MIDDFAVRQHGIVTRAQLVGAGVAVHAIDHRVKRGRLHIVYRGIYRVGPVPVPFGREMAAVLACGAAAVLSHRSAAVLWGLLPERPDDTWVHVSVRRGCRAPGAPTRVHRVFTLYADETTECEGIPVTVPARTVLDLARVCRNREVEQALAQGERSGQLDPARVAAILARHPRHAGVPLLRALLAGDGRPALTRSEAESRFLELVRKARLPAPEVNAPVGSFEVDFVWRDARLVVEVDGFAFHTARRAFERDRRRDAELAAAGYRVVRVTWRHLTCEPEALLVRLTQAVMRTGGS